MKRQLLYLAAAVPVGLQAPSAFAQCTSCGECSSCSKCDKHCKCTEPPCDCCPDCSDPCCHRWNITVCSDCYIDKLIETLSCGDCCCDRVKAAKKLGCRLHADF